MSGALLAAASASWSQALDQLKDLAQDAVITAVRSKLRAHGVDLPFPTRQTLFHDQTEATDGDRGRQREGWPGSAGPR